MRDLPQAAFHVQRELERLRAAGAPEESLAKLKQVLTSLREVDVEATNERRCVFPRTAVPGDRWICPECGREWWAEDENDGSLYIWWKTDISRKDG